MLFIFKYSVFAAQNLEALFAYFGVKLSLVTQIPEFCLILPVGISFYTFQSLSYTIDVYRGRIQATSNFIHLMAFLMFFPQLVAGPIVRAKDLLYQLLKEPQITPRDFQIGLKLTIIGFFKKCFLADNAAPYVNSTFAGIFSYDSTLLWWMTMILFTIQIYCDFSGYSDIARGIAKLLGYHFPLNFNHPYFSCGFRDFWKRWHISLSSWFMDYVYIPLGGNVEKVRGRSLWNRLLSCRNLFITMLISGVWHGAAWNFILWGAVHGFLLIIEKITLWPKHLTRLCKGKLIPCLLTCLMIPLTWVFFRVESPAGIGHIFNALFSYTPMSEDCEIMDSLHIILFFFIMEFYLYLRPIRFLPSVAARQIYRWDAVGFAFLAVITIFFRGEGNEFIYFQF